MAERRRRAVSCECGVCHKCKTRQYMAARRTDATYAEQQRDASRQWYRALSTTERQARTSSRTDYQRLYREANRDQLKKQNAKRYAANRETERLRRKDYYQRTAERAKARALAHYRANPQKAAARATEWNRTNALRRAEIIRKWDRAHPEQKSITWHRRRSRLKGGGGHYTAEQIGQLAVRQEQRCAAPWCRCTLKRFHRDHIYPVSGGGSSWIENIQLLCHKCNLNKRDKDPNEWCREHGHLPVFDRAACRCEPAMETV